jgi:enoyl-CoA hydratase/carnithine racemase
MTELTNETGLLRDDDGGVTTLTLNRPDKFNSMTEDVVEGLQAIFDDVKDDPACRVIVLTAAGDRAFCAGHDLAEMIGNPEPEFYDEAFRRSADLTRAMYALPQPIVARVQGLTTAGGCQLVAACDMAVAADTATFAANGITNGLFCSMPAVTLSRNVPRKQAFNLLFTGAFISAGQALDIGLVNQVVAPEDLDAAIEKVTSDIVAKPRYAVARGKEMFYRQLQMPVGDALDYAADLMTEDMSSDAAREGITAFTEKRKPVWE